MEDETTTNEALEQSYEISKAQIFLRPFHMEW